MIILLDEESQHSTKETISNDDLLVFIPLITAGLYFSTIAYFQSYFRAIGIEQNLLNLNLDYYIINGFGPILIVILVICLCLMGLMPSKNLSKRFMKSIAFFSNFPILAAGLVIGYWGITSDRSDLSSTFFSIFSICFGVGTILLYLIYSGIGVSFWEALWNGTSVHKISMIVTILLICGLFSMFLGEYEGTEFIKGDTPSSIKI